MYSDGVYKVTAIHGPANRIREIQIANGIVRLNGFTFTQDDFFKVNRLV